jgi:hypothetical protein
LAQAKITAISVDRQPGTEILRFDPVFVGCVDLLTLGHQQTLSNHKDFDGFWAANRGPAGFIKCVLQLNGSS